MRNTYLCLGFVVIGSTALSILLGCLLPPLDDCHDQRIESPCPVDDRDYGLICCPDFGPTISCRWLSITNGSLWWINGCAFRTLISSPVCPNAAVFCGRILSNETHPPSFAHVRVIQEGWGWLPIFVGCFAFAAGLVLIFIYCLRTFPRCSYLVRSSYTPIL